MRKLLSVFVAKMFELSASAALAISGADAINQRRELMKADGAATKPVVAMLQGKAPFDLATVQKSLNTYVNAMSKEPALFPPDSKTGDTNALPVIWDDDNMADLNARFKKLGDDAKPRLPRRQGATKATMPGVLKNCGAPPREVRGEAVAAARRAATARADRSCAPGSPPRSASRASSSQPRRPQRGSPPPRAGLRRSRSGGVRAGRPPRRGKRLLHRRLRVLPTSPGQKDPLRPGRSLKTPFGTFFPPNISPDPAGRIGAWRAADLANALMAGVSPKGEHLYPPHPSYRRMSLTDVRDLFAFLRTTAPVAGRAPPHALAFPFSIRRAVGFWKLLYLPEIAHPPAADPTDLEDRGRSLVEGPGHCAECHSPRTFLGGIIASRRLTGGPLPDGKGKAPNITAAGLADWSESDIADALSTGFTPSGDTLGGPMAAMVRNLAQAPAADLAAIAHYLKTYKPGAP